MTELENALKILGLQPNVTPEELKSRYRELLNEYHPDRHESENFDEKQRDAATARTQEIIAAYEIVRKSLSGNDFIAAGPSGVLKWSLDPIARVAGVPVVADGVVFFCTRSGEFWAVDADTKVLKWRFRTSGEMRYSPKVADGMACFRDSDSLLYAIDVHTPAEKWRVRQEKGGWYTPAADGEFVFSVGGSGATILALDRETGKVRWDYPVAGEISASPVVGQGMLYLTTWSGYCYALDIETHKQKWRSKLRGPCEGGSCLANNRLFLVSDSGSLLELDAESGQPKWSAAIPFNRCRPVVGEGIICCCSQFPKSAPEVFALDVNTKKEIWRRELDGSRCGSLAVENGVLYALSVMGMLWAFDAQTGQELWRFRSDCTFGSHAVHNGVVYLGCYNALKAIVGPRSDQEVPLPLPAKSDMGKT